MIYYLKDINDIDKDQDFDSKKVLFDINFDYDEYRIIEYDFLSDKNINTIKRKIKDPTLIIAECTSSGVAYQLARIFDCVALIFNPIYEQFVSNNKWKNPLINVCIHRKDYNLYLDWYSKHTSENVIAMVDINMTDNVSYEMFLKYFDRCFGYSRIFLK